MGQVAILVHIDVVPGKLDELRKVYKEFHDGTWEVPGLLYTHIMQSVDDQNKLYIFEAWETEEDYARHIQSRRYREFGQAIHGLDTTEGYIRDLVPF